MGVTLNAQPTDFNVLLDIIYGEDMDYDVYTIGWSGRVERLDPDMFIHSINHSSNAVPGANNTSRYRNPEFDALADAQRSEMDMDERQRLVWEAQRILAEDVPRITTYSRANLQTYNKEKYTNVLNMSGEGLFNEWTPMVVEPLTDDKTLIVGSNINITNLNPFAARSVYDWRNLRLIYDKLVCLTVDVEPEPWAATGWDIIDDTLLGWPHGDNDFRRQSGLVPGPGELTLDGHTLDMRGRNRLNFRREVQMIFQDPYETLNPRFNVLETIAEPLRIHGVKEKDEIHRRVLEVLELAELKPPEQYLYSFPHELSGGQRQRVAIARGIVLEPKFLVADEPVSMLDVSIRADILNLLKKLRQQMGLTMLYVSHDLSTIKYLCDRIAVMYLGKIVEIGPVNEVVAAPQHPYTKALLSAVPVADPDYVKERLVIDDEVPDQINLPEGCRFRPRCPYATAACVGFSHELVERAEGQFSACIYTPEEWKSPVS